MDPNLVFVRVEGDVLSPRPFRILAHYARNAQAFTERAYRLPAVTLMTLLRPALSVENPVLGTRLLYLPLRGMSRDRLDLLGEEYFNYVLSTRLRKEGIRQIEELHAMGKKIVLVSDELDHLIRPLALHLKAHFLATNRLEFRDDLATGRLLEPVIPALGVTAGLTSTERRESTGWKAFGKEVGPQELFDCESSFDSPRAPAKQDDPSSYCPVHKTGFHTEAVVGPWKFIRQKDSFDRLYGIHREGMADDASEGFARNRPHLLADPASWKTVGTATI